VHSEEIAVDGHDLTVTRRGEVALVILDRPSARNALSSSVVNKLDAAMRMLDADGSIHAVVLTGSEPGFCAGSDLKELAGKPVAEMAVHEARTGQVVRALQHLGKPVVAAVEGFALGGGFLLATGCDVVVSAENTRWELPEVRLGWVPPWGLQSLVSRAGPTTARRLAWGDQASTGADLYRLGVIDELVPPGKALERAMEVAERLATLPPEAVSSTKRALSDAVVDAAELLDARATRLFARNCESDAARTSLTSFARPPKETTR